MSYARPFGRYWPGYLALSVVSVVFGIINYALLGPLLTVLFEPDKIVTQTVPAGAGFSIESVTSLFGSFLTDVVRSGGVVRGLLLVCLLIVFSCFICDLCRYLSQRILVSMKTNI